MSGPTATRLSGVLPVFQTPYRDDLSIDFATLERELAWLYERGAAGVVMAMVSETLRLSSEERDQLAEAACRFGSGRGPVVISVGAESTHTAVRHAQHAAQCGAAAMMAIPPASMPATEDQVLAYYRCLLQAVDLPLIVQDASGYVGRPMSIAMQARLLDEYGQERVLFKPEANPIGPRLSALHAATDGRARIFEGSGGIALVASYRRGVAGTMPGADLIDGVVALWNALEAGDEQRAYRLSLPLAALVVLVMPSGLDGFLALEKHLLVKQGVFRNTLIRGPVGFVLDDETGAEADRLFEQLQQAVEETGS